MSGIYLNNNPLYIHFKKLASGLAMLLSATSLFKTIFILFYNKTCFEPEEKLINRKASISDTVAILFAARKTRLVIRVGNHIKILSVLMSTHIATKRT